MCNKLWPHDIDAVDIDIEYFKALPHIPYVEGYQEYVKMYFWNSSAGELSDRDAIITLMTEKFDTYEEAAHFANVFEKHCYGIVEIEKNIVYGKTLAYIVNSYYSGKTGRFEFANWA